MRREKVAGVGGAREAPGFVPSAGVQETSRSRSGGGVAEEAAVAGEEARARGEVRGEGF